MIYSERELNDSTDVFYCVEAATGKELWSHSYPAAGNLDYGNSTRATPLIDGERVFLRSAFGHLFCVELKSGKVLWEKDLIDEFKVKDDRKWGHCSNPILADGKLIVNPGRENASIVALDPKTGKVLWKSPGRPASYGNFIVGTFGGKRQIVGHDVETLGGWDVETGKRLWEVTPKRRGDFNVPTPMQVGDQLLVTTENNGARLFKFKDGGVIDPSPWPPLDESVPTRRVRWSSVRVSLGLTAGSNASTSRMASSRSGTATIPPLLPIAVSWPQKTDSLLSPLTAL